MQVRKNRRRAVRAAASAPRPAGRPRRAGRRGRPAGEHLHHLGVVSTWWSLLTQDVHTPEYLSSLKSSAAIARVCELPPLAVLPYCILESRVLRPARLAVRGTMRAAELALAHGYAINLGGGMHHASAGAGGGWCIYADIFLAYRHVRRSHPGLRMLIVDLDVHQGNGLARDKARLHPDEVYIVDAFNPRIYPGDVQAQRSVNMPVHFTADMSEADYLQSIQTAVTRAIEGFRPGLLMYNAGTDILVGDPLNGGIGISEAGVARRDAIVFAAARAARVPIAMVLSGGYARRSAAVVSASILGLAREFGLLGVPPAGSQADTTGVAAERLAATAPTV
eukprot:m.98385 g.98385  ORF g.98385 m.98385 type:complete len:336 (+) comp8693_c0_seq5:255-1262(+)